MVLCFFQVRHLFIDGQQDSGLLDKRGSRRRSVNLFRKGECFPKLYRSLLMHAQCILHVIKNTTSIFWLWPLKTWDTCSDVQFGPLKSSLEINFLPFKVYFIYLTCCCFFFFFSPDWKRCILLQCDLINNWESKRNVRPKNKYQTYR